MNLLTLSEVLVDLGVLENKLLLPFPPYIVQLFLPLDFFISFIMKKQAFSSFLEKMDNLSNNLETKQKKEAIGMIVSSLQRPFTEVLRAVCEKQKQDVEELYKSLGWEKKS
jgi:hypothetical protein